MSLYRFKKNRFWPQSISMGRKRRENKGMQLKKAGGLREGRGLQKQIELRQRRLTLNLSSGIKKRVKSRLRTLKTRGMKIKYKSDEQEFQPACLPPAPRCLALTSAPIVRRTPPSSSAGSASPTRGPHPQARPTRFRKVCAALGARWLLASSGYPSFLVWLNLTRKIIAPK